MPSNEAPSRSPQVWPAGFDYSSIKEAFMANPAVIFANPSGVIQYWSAGMTELFGFGESDVIGATLDVIVPPGYRERHWIGYHAAMDLADGVVDHGSFNVPALHKDGRTIRLEVHLNVIHDSRGRVVGAFAAFSPDQGHSDSIEPL
jgi:PAS domain S-box-containing protein